MPKLNIQLTDEMARYVETEIGDGHFPSPSALVSESLSLLQRDRALEAEKIVLLRQAVEAGLADAAAGRISHRTARDIAESLIAEDGVAP